MTTELIAKNGLSKDLSANLKASGANLEDAHIAQMLDETENSRATYQARAILSGIALIAKQLQLGNRKLKPWFEKLSSQRAAKIEYRTAYTYKQLANRFLSGLESGQFNQELLDKGITELDAEGAITLIHDTNQGPFFLEQIEAFVGGRSIRQMLADFSAAAQDANAEIAAKEQAEKDPAPQNPSPTGKAGTQINFFDTLEADLKEADAALTGVIENPLFISEEISADDKLKGIQRTRDYLKTLDTKLRDKAKALKEGATA